MSKQNLFVPKLKNHVSRNAFDVSQRRIYSAKPGEILPCFIRDCLPGDKIKINASSFTRTAPLNNAAFARVKQYFNFYFVPFRLLYRDFPSFVIQQSNSSKAAVGIDKTYEVPSELPYTTEHDLSNITNSYFTPNSQHPHESLFMRIDGDSIGKNPTPLYGILNRFGLSNLTQSCKLLQYLGYYKMARRELAGSAISDLERSFWDTNNTKLSLFPLLAYQKIYNDYYRFSQWENENAATYNVDYLCNSSSMRIPIAKLYDSDSETGGWIPKFYSDTPLPLSLSNMFSMRYVNFTKDSFLGVVPSSQFGAVSTINMPLEFESKNADWADRMYIKSDSDNTPGTIAAWSSSAGQNQLGANINGDYRRTSVHLTDYNNNDFFERYKTSFDILTLRAAQAKQKYMEVTLSNNSDYKSQIEAHFNVKVSSLMSNLCDYIGGFSSDLSLDTVVNNNLSDGNTADYSALATMQGEGKIEFTTREHGLIVGVSYILPFVDYEVQGYDFPVLRTSFDSFALPEYDKLGYEEVDPRLLTGYQYGSQVDSAHLLHLGYGPRYYDYKTNIDVVLGDFNSTLDGTQPLFTVNLNNNASNIPKKLASVLDASVNHGIIGDTLRRRVDAYSFKVSPTILNNLFTVQVGIVENADLPDTHVRKYVIHDDCSFDQFYNVISFNTTVISNLDRLGLPY